MSIYTPDSQEVLKLFNQVLNGPARIQEMPHFADFDEELGSQILEEAAKFITGTISPLNAVGDSHGCIYQHGDVKTPPGFASAYKNFWQSGWASLSADTEHGGQGLPLALEFIVYEWLSGANHGWTMAPGLLHGAYETLKHHGSQSLIDQYLGKIATGEWLATMCITEAHAGSDLGLLQTKAHQEEDGQTYSITGTKIFISGGEHDLSSNIVHLVLARLSDAPKGTKGLSLFLVPKFYEDGTRSAVYCERIEEKMGIHGSPTCVMRFEDAKGWLIGEENKGLNAMFLMMNAARLHVALQGIGLLDAAVQKGTAYALERKQFRAPKPQSVVVENANQNTSSIIEHPQIKKIIDKNACQVKAFRLLAYQTALMLDISKHHPDEKTRLKAQQWSNVVTPVLKASCTQNAFDGISECLQVFGGHGYVSEWGIEQHLRDSRIAMIYEGTNEIQAIDLMTRKVLPDQGLALNTILDDLLKDIQETQSSEVLQKMYSQIKETTQNCVQMSTKPDGLYRLNWIMQEYLRLLTIALLGWSCALLNERDKSTDSNATEDYNPWRIFQKWMLPDFEKYLQIIHEELS